MNPENEKKEFPENTLNVRGMEIVDSSRFLGQFIGKGLIVWGADLKNMYSISELSGYGYFSPRMVLFGKYKEVFESETCFGFTVRDGSLKFWVDSFNEKEMAVITYNRRPRGVKGE